MAGDGGLDNLHTYNIGTGSNYCLDCGMKTKFNPDLPKCVIVYIGAGARLNEELREKLYDYSTEEVEDLPANYIVCIAEANGRSKADVELDLYEDGVPFDELHVSDEHHTHVVDMAIRPRYNIVAFFSAELCHHNVENGECVHCRLAIEEEL